MKRNLDTGVEVYDNIVKKNQRHITNEKPNMYLDIFNENLYNYIQLERIYEYNIQGFIEVLFPII